MIFSKLGETLHRLDHGRGRGSSIFAQLGGDRLTMPACVPWNHQAGTIC